MRPSALATNGKKEGNSCSHHTLAPSVFAWCFIREILWHARSFVNLPLFRQPSSWTVRNQCSLHACASHIKSSATGNLPNVLGYPSACCPRWSAGTGSMVTVTAALLVHAMLHTLQKNMSKMFYRGLCCILSLDPK